MKKRTLLISFLLMLYIVPLILVPSSYHTAIPTEPNISKDFSSSEYGEESSYSITSFSETLEDDVLFYPDETTVTDLADNGVVVGTESGTFESTFLKDGSTWHGLTTEEYYLEFEVVGTGIPISYALYFTSVSDTPVLQAYNFTLSGFVTVDTISQNSWSNGSLNSLDYVNSTGYVLLQVANSQAENAFLDYAELTHPGMTLADSEHYAESFSDVSDWNIEASTESFTTDGDVATLVATGENDNDYEYVYVTGIAMPISSSTYFEFRYKNNDTIADYIQIRLYDITGTKFYFYQYNEMTTWTTGKDNILSMFENSGGAFSTIDQVRLNLRIDNGLVEDMMLDYLHISPSDEIGWQHDGSTTEGISSSDGGTVSSDGDVLTLQADSDGATFVIVPDTTTTASMISTYKYQFMTIYQADGSFPSLCKFTATWSDDSTTDMNNFGYHVGMNHYNLLAISGGKDLKYLTISVDSYGTDTVLIALIKAYSIANWTVTQVSTMPISHYLYANDGALHRAGSSISGYYFTLTFDPTLAVDTSTYNIWNLTVSDRGTSYTYDFAFKSKINDTWGSYSFDITRGESASGTLSSVQFIIYDSMTISAIKFIDNHNWHLIDEVTVIFYVEIDQFTINLFLVIAGLVMLPLSTLFLAYSIRHNMTQDKLLLFIVMLLFAFGLLIGGILS